MRLLLVIYALSVLAGAIAAEGADPYLRLNGITSSTRDRQIHIHVRYSDGTNHTAADRFIWTLPDLTTLSPGESNNEYEANIRDPDFPEDGSYHYYRLRILDGDAVDRSEFNFTVSGPSEDGSTERWSESLHITVTSDHMVEGETNVVPQVSQQPDSLDSDGSALVRMKVEGGVPADEDLVEWRLTHESFTLKPGMKNGLYKALSKSVGEDGHRMYTLKVTPDIRLGRTSFRFHVEKVGHWSTTSPGSFLPPDSWRDLTSAAMPAHKTDIFACMIVILCSILSYKL